MRIAALVGALLAVPVFLGLSGVDPVPVLVLMGLLAVVVSMPQVRGAAQRVGERRHAPAIPEVAFDDIGGQSRAKKELMEGLEFLAQEARARRLGIRPLRGILLAGPPGTGKTLLAKAAAHYTRSAFVACAGSEFVEMYAGVGAQRVREVFDRARRLARQAGHGSTIVFLDEIEVLGGKRGAHHSHMEYDQTLNQLLIEMDGIGSGDDARVLVVGATNRPDLLDDALLRPGRFDRVVRVDLPDREDRFQILRVHTRNKPLAEGVDLMRVARETFGFSGAHLESLANEAAILAMRASAPVVEERFFLEAIDKVMLGDRLDRRPTSAELRRIAVHETGHALVGEVYRPGSVATLTITPRGQTLGYVRRAPADDVLIETRADLLADIAVALAGGLAEEILLDGRSTGAAQDLEQALAAARRIVLVGMSPLGVVDEELVPREALHRAVGEILAEVEAQVRAVLLSHRERILEVAERLMTEERMDGQALRAALGLGGGRSLRVS